jgi:voltage-gated potassium channel
VLEWTLTLLFTAEYLARLLCVRHPLRYARSFYGVIDLLAVLPTYLAVLVPGLHALIDVRVLRLLRIFRILKLGAYVAEYGALGAALWATRRKILVFLTFVLMVAVVLGTMMYVVEGPANGFTSIPVSIYWAITTVTTVGFGDITPKTDLGRLISSMMMLLGWGTLAVPTGIVSAEFAARRGQEPTTRHCPDCLSEGHLPSARYCRDCGARLPPGSAIRPERRPIAFAAAFPRAPAVRARAAALVAHLARRGFGGLLPGLGQRGLQLLGRQALEGAEVGLGQRGLLEVAQQVGAVAPGLVLLGAPGLGDGAAPGQLVQRGLAVLVADRVGGLAVQVQPVAGLAQGDQVAGATGVAAQEGRQHGLGEHAGRPGLDVGLHAQLDRLGRAREQRRKALLELLGAFGGTHRRRRRRRGGRASGAAATGVSATVSLGAGAAAEGARASASGGVGWSAAGGVGIEVMDIGK